MTFDTDDEYTLEVPISPEAARFAAVVDVAHDGMLTIDENHKIRMFNRAAEKIFGYGAEEVLGRPLDILIPQSGRADHSKRVHEFELSPAPSKSMFSRGAVYGQRKDGREFPAEITISKISVLGRREYAAVIRDVSDRAALMDELRLKATTDPLTGLANRAVLMERGPYLLSLAKRHNHSFAVLMVDIDHFKSVNDTYGHDMGDQTIIALGKLMTNLVRDTDVVVRYGGEEFIIVLPQLNSKFEGDDGTRVRRTVEGAKELAERIRVAVEQGDSQNFSIPIPVTVSVGLSPFLDQEDTFEKILKRADLALYQAKHGGRNKVAVTIGY